MGTENKNCPSYDYGICVTAPERHEVKCKDLTCRWQNIEEFNKVKDSLFEKGKNSNV